MMNTQDAAAPLVSVCMPIFNSAKHLEEALLSIVGQDFDDMEIIVVDNASVDDTVAVAERVLTGSGRRHSIVRNDVNIGFAGNCNKAISLARGKYVSILHGDDIYDPTMIGAQAAVLEKQPAFLGCFVFPNCINEAGQRLPHAAYKIERGGTHLIDVDLETYVETLCQTGDNILFCPSSMIRSEAYKKAGPYNANNRLVEDADMWVRLLQFGNLAVINQRLVNYRIHSLQASAEYRVEDGAAVDTDIRFMESFVQHNSEQLRRHAHYYLGLLRRLKARRELRRIVNGVRTCQLPVEPAVVRVQATRDVYRFGLNDARAWAVQSFPLLILSLLGRPGKA